MFLTKEQYDEEQKYWHNKFTKQCTVCKGHGNIYNDEIKNYKFCQCVENVFLYTGLSVGRIPKKFINWEWDWCYNTTYINKCKEYSDNYLVNLSKGRHLYLFGANGKGKTTIETILAKEIMRKINPNTKKHFTVAFFMFDEIITLFHQRNTVRSTELLDKLINWPNVLIIDNLGSEVGFDSDSKFNVKALESILRRRDNVADSTNIISSNLTPAELQKHYGDAIFGLITNSYECINFNDKGGKQNNNINDKIAKPSDELIVKLVDDEPIGIEKTEVIDNNDDVVVTTVDEVIKPITNKVKKIKKERKPRKLKSDIQEDDGEDNELSLNKIRLNDKVNVGGD